MSFGHFKNDQPPLAGEGGRENFDHTHYTTNHQKPIERVLNAISDRGGRVNRSGVQWMCTCPGHDDRTPSLSVKEGDDGCVLIKCFAGCSIDAVAGALGLEMRELFPNDTTVTAGSRTHRPQKPRSDSGSGGSTPRANGFERLDDAISAYAYTMGTPDRRWEYHNAQGELVGVILRWETQAEGKPGKEIRPISLIDGRWVLMGMPGPRPLYRLPSIMNTDEPVIVCEGEKAADAAIACGYTATTSPHGCKNPQNADWSCIRGRDVVIVPDHDEAGQAYARVAFQMCRNAGAQRVRIVDLHDGWEGLSKGDDLADVVSIEGGDSDSVRTKLEELIEQTQPESSVHNSEGSASVYRPFPVDLLPEPVRSYVSQGAAAIGCDASYIALPMLSMLAGAIGNTHALKLKNTHHEPPIVWSCIIGYSGTAKSPALDLATRPLRTIQYRQLIEHEQALRLWRKARKSSPDEPDPPPCERCVLDDATIEGALHLMSQNPRGSLLIRDELAGWLDFDRYASNKGGFSSSRWLELFSGRSVHIDRRSQDPIHIRRASMSITGGIQPGILRRVLSQSLLENGLAARMLFAMPPRTPRRWREDDLSPAIESQVQQLVERLHALTMDATDLGACPDDPQPHALGLTSDAARLFHCFYDEHHASMVSEEEHITAACVKLESYCARFALIMHLVREAANDPTLEDPERVDAHSLQVGIDLVEWFKHETKRVYAMLSMDETQQEDQRVIDWINKQGGAVSVREFSRGLARYNNSTRAQQKLNELEKAGYGWFQGRPPRGKTQEFVLFDEYRAAAASIDTATCRPQTPENPRNDSGASGRYPIPSNRKGQ